LAAGDAQTARRRAAARSARRPVREEQRSAVRPERWEAAPYALTAAAYPRLRLRAAAEAQVESAAQLPAGRPLPEAIVLRRQVAAARELARAPVEAARKARRLVGPGASAEQAAARPPEEPAVRPRAAAPQLEAVAEMVAWVEAPQPEEARDAVAVPQLEEAEALAEAAVP
jgi:hypothetical protein